MRAWGWGCGAGVVFAALALVGVAAMLLHAPPDGVVARRSECQAVARYAASVSAAMGAGASDFYSPLLGGSEVRPQDVRDTAEMWSSLRSRREDQPAFPRQSRQMNPQERLMLWVLLKREPVYGPQRPLGCTAEFASLGLRLDPGSGPRSEAAKKFGRSTLTYFSRAATLFGWALLTESVSSCESMASYRNAVEKFRVYNPVWPARMVYPATGGWRVVSRGIKANLGPVTPASACPRRQIGA